MTKTARIINLVAIASLISTVALAQEKDRRAALEELAAARTGAQIVIQELQQLIDGNLSGYNAKANNISFAYNQISVMLQRAIQQEQAKPEDSRLKVLIEDCVRMSQNIADRWTKYNSKEKPALDASIGEVYNLFHYAFNPLVTTLINVDMPYNKLNLDSSLLKAVYLAAEARGNELKAQVKAALDGIANLETKWEEDLKNTENLTGQKVD